MAKRSPAAIFLWIIGGIAVLMGLGATLVGIYQQELIAWSSIPKHAFADEATPPPPNYTLDSAWAALPSQGHRAKMTPSGIYDAAVMPDVDVFYIPPTTYNKPDRWSVPFDDPSVRTFLDALILPNQVSVFHPRANIFVPRYRQAGLGAFYDVQGGRQAIDTAHQDILTAFWNFQEQRNQGRPFILAGQGQGALHGMKLLMTLQNYDDIMDRMIVAYMPGWATAIDQNNKTTFGTKACETAQETGCIVSWLSYDESNDTPDLTRYFDLLNIDMTSDSGLTMLCTNPLTWTIGDTAMASLNKGSILMETGQDTLAAPIAELTGARCDNGVLKVRDTLAAEWHQFDLGGGDLTLYDINLFYMNIRSNIATRIAAWKEMHNG